MGKTLTAILTGLFLGTTVSACTPEGRSLGLSLLTHAAREKISNSVNPNETNVNVYNQGQNNQRNLGDEYILRGSNLPPSFTCLGIVDTNKDGVIERGELIGLRSYFECKKIGDTLKVMCGTTWDKVKGKRGMIKFKETNTVKIIGAREFPPFVKDSKIMAPYLYFKKTPMKEGIKSYTVEYYIDGKKIPTRTIEFFIDYGKKGE